MDDADSADINMAQEMEFRIRAIRNAKPEATEVPDGECANECGTPAIPGGRHCSKECAEDHDARKQLRKRQGG